MTETATRERTPWAIPDGAQVEWQILASALEDAGTVPCRQGDAEAWFPDKKHLDAPSTRLAVQGCWRCPAREPCLAYAVVAKEREGVWGGLLPDERTAELSELSVGVQDTCQYSLLSSTAQGATP